MQTQMAEAPVYYQENNTGLTSKQDANRHLTRYAFSIGDHIEPGDKYGLQSVGGRMGGLWIGHSEIEGAPTMKRTNFMIYRGGIVPLETIAIGKKADHRSERAGEENYLTGPGVPPGVRGYTVYAGDTMGYLQSDRFRPMGVVELTALRGFNWDNGIATGLQKHFFPNWNIWLSGEKSPPFLLVDWEDFVMDGIDRGASEDVIATTGNEMLESARLFRNYANNHIEKNRQIIQSQRSTNTGGFFVGWNERSRLYAKQLGVSLEDAREIASSTAMSSSELELRKQEVEVQRQQTAAILELLKANVGQIPNIEAVETVSEIKEPETINEYDVSNGLEKQIEPRECVDLKDDGSPCPITAISGMEVCHIHKRKRERQQKEN